MQVHTACRSAVHATLLCLQRFYAVVSAMMNELMPDRLGDIAGTLDQGVHVYVHGLCCECNALMQCLE